MASHQRAMDTHINQITQQVAICPDLRGIY